MCIGVYLHVYHTPCACGTYEGQKAMDPLEL